MKNLKKKRGRERKDHDQACPNQNCEIYGIVNHEDVIGNGHQKNGEQEYKCNQCEARFNRRKGTSLEGLRTQIYVIVMVMVMAMYMCGCGNDCCCYWKTGENKKEISSHTLVQIVEFISRLKNVGKTVNTSYVERFNLSLRCCLCSLIRRALAAAKKKEELEGQMFLFQPEFLALLNQRQVEE